MRRSSNLERIGQDCCEDQRGQESKETILCESNLPPLTSLTSLRFWSKPPLNQTFNYPLTSLTSILKKRNLSDIITHSYKGGPVNECHYGQNPEMPRWPELTKMHQISYVLTKVLLATNNNALALTTKIDILYRPMSKTFFIKPTKNDVSDFYKAYCTNLRIVQKA